MRIWSTPHTSPSLAAELLEGERRRKDEKEDWRLLSRFAFELRRALPALAQVMYVQTTRMAIGNEILSQP